MAVYDAQEGRVPAPEAELCAAQRDADETSLHEGVAGLAGLVAGNPDVHTLLVDVSRIATSAIPGADGVGVALLPACGGEGSIAARASSPAVFERVDTVQFDELREGPGLSAVATGRPTVSGSLGGDGRWPRFGGRVARMAVHSAMALPLTVEDQIVGVLTVYAHGRDAFGSHAVHVGAEFADSAAVLVHNGWLLTQAQEETAALHRALGSRSIIDQAIGIIRSRSGATSSEAFDSLTRMSQSENVKLHIVAERLVTEAVGRAHALRRR